MSATAECPTTDWWMVRGGSTYSTLTYQNPSDDDYRYARCYLPIDVRTSGSDRISDEASFSQKISSSAHQSIGQEEERDLNSLSA